MFCILLGQLALAACAGRGPDDGRPDPADENLPNRPLEVYRQQGLVTGTEEFAAVGDFATLAGPGDSTWVIFAMSLPSAALRFHRDGDGFTAGYSVRLRFLRDGVERVLSRRAAQVRVATFEETGRTEESVFYQQPVLLEPGTWVVEVAISDSIGRRGLEAVDTLDVPSFAGADAAPALLLVHRTGAVRAGRASPPDLVLNGRHAAAFGGEPPRVYLEGYDGADASLELRVADASGRELLTMPVPVAAPAGGEVRAGGITLPLDSLPLGLLRLSARAPRTGATSRTETLLVTISDQWMVANYEEVLDYLAFIASGDEIDRLRDATTPAERRAAWEAFWVRRDPVPASPVNEYREEFFARVRVAAEQFAEIGRPGWRTDRGRVYIVLGPPDRVVHGELDARDISGVLDAIEWVYERASGGRMELLFVDREGFGRFVMTRNSELTFRSIADRLRVPSE